MDEKEIAYLRDILDNIEILENFLLGVDKAAFFF